MSGHCLCNNSSRAGQFLVAALPKMGSSEREQPLEGGTTTGWSLGLGHRAPEMLTERLPPAASHLTGLVLKISFVSSAGDKAPYWWEWKLLWHHEESPWCLPWAASRSLSKPGERWNTNICKVCCHEKSTWACAFPSPHLSRAFTQHQTGCKIVTPRTKGKCLHFQLALLTSRSPALKHVSNTSILNNNVDNGWLLALIVPCVVWENSKASGRTAKKSWEITTIDLMKW